MEEVKFLAYYLPQYHPIPENDAWWCKGFTEWTNVTRAKPLFKGHYQPILPADLGFYDLRIPEIQEAQSQLALDYGIDGFIYYQYWFGEGKILLEQPAEKMLKNKNIQLPFCFCWANETWKGIWHGLNSPDVLIEQTYSGEAGYRDYFEYLLPFFKDERYIKVNNMPMFHIYRIEDIPDWEVFVEVFNNQAIKNGFDGIYLIATIVSNTKRVLEDKHIYGQIGVDVFQRMRYKKYFHFSEIKYLGWLERKIKTKLGFTNQVGKRNTPLIVDYSKAVGHFNSFFPNKKYIPCVFPNWDNTARSGKKSLIFKNANPEAWGKHLYSAVKEILKHPKNPKWVVIKSWNEWAEGNHLEPDKKHGLGWLETVKSVKEKMEK